MKRENWIDITKCVAIIAVIVDHLYTRAYNSEVVLKLTYFSVGLFILAQGFSTYLSYSNTRVPLYKKALVRIRNIIVAYIFATFVCLIFLYKSFDFTQFITSLINFNTTGPYYYVGLYIQLVIISPIIFTIVKRCDSANHPIFVKILFLGMIIIISYFTSNYTKLNDSYGGGSKLFGGSYLILLYIGMIIGNSYPRIVCLRKPMRVVMMIATLTMAFICFYCINMYGFNWTSYEMFGPGINPPGIPLMLYSSFVFGIIMICGIQLDSMCSNSKLMSVVSYIGSHTLYIFLYHEIILIGVDPYVVDLNIWIKRFVYMIMMIMLPLLFERVVGWLKNNIIRESYF